MLVESGQPKIKIYFLKNSFLKKILKIVSKKTFVHNFTLN